jgi:hypothetical protein
MDLMRNTAGDLIRDDGLRPGRGLDRSPKLADRSPGHDRTAAAVGETL